MAMTGSIISGRSLMPVFADAQGDTATHIDIDQAGLIAVIGPDMASRSGWLRLLAAIDMPAAGVLKLFGQDVMQLDKPAWTNLRIRLAYLNQESALLSVLPVLENILLPSLYHGLGQRDELLGKAEQLLQDTGRVDRASLRQLPAYVDALAYCQALVVRVLLMQPRILIMDNMFRQLDAVDADRLMRFVLAHAKQQGITLVINADNSDLAMQHADSILFAMPTYMLQFGDRRALRASTHDDVVKYVQAHSID